MNLAAFMISLSVIGGMGAEAILTVTLRRRSPNLPIFWIALCMAALGVAVCLIALGKIL